MKKILVTMSIFLTTISFAQTNNLSYAELPNGNVSDRIKSGLFITSKFSNRVLTKTNLGVQIAQNELVTGTSSPAQNANITLEWTGEFAYRPGYAQGVIHPIVRIIWGDVATYPSQIWKLLNPNPLVNSNNNGTPVITAQDDGNYHGLFVIEQTGDGDNSVYLRSQVNGKCLQIAGSSPNNSQSGSLLELWDKTGSPNQKFFIKKRTGGNNTLNPIALHIDYTQRSNVSVYPNPAHKVINIAGLPVSGAQFEASISDISGKIVKTLQVNNRSEINVSNLLSGMYILNIKTGDQGKDTQVRFLKN